MGQRTPTGKGRLTRLAPTDVEADVAEPFESFTPNTATSMDA
jgi:hypothetical protein